MIEETHPTYRFPKSLRLLKRRDFQFNSYKRFQTEHFRFIYASEGRGRMGISLSKRVLKNAVARNRVKRLLKETFRHNAKELTGYDVNVIGQGSLKNEWSTLKRVDLEGEFSAFLARLGREPKHAVS